MKYIDDPERGLVGSKAGMIGRVGDKLSLLVTVLVVIIGKDVGGGVLLGVLFLLRKGELAGLGLEVTSTRNNPCT